MLPRENRLTKAYEIKKLYQKGQSAQSGLFRIKWLVRKDNKTKTTVIVGLKFSKKATSRNLIKRRIRSSLHSLIASLKPINLIVQPQSKPLKSFSFDAITQDLTSLFQKNKLLL